MSQTRPRGARTPAVVARRAEAERVARRRRYELWGGAVLLVVVVVAAVVGFRLSARSTAAAGAPPGIGQLAPNATFTTLAGRTESIASLRGKPTLLWLMTTWCSSCQASTQTLAQNLSALEADGVRVVEVENYDDLGQSGPPLAQFGKVLAGPAFSNPDWTFAESSLGLTRTYNPRSDLDIYYLLNAKGEVTYVNSTPAATMSQLLGAAGRLS